MTIKIEVTHWHDSDGWSRDDGFKAVVTDEFDYKGTVYSATRNGSIRTALALIGADVEIVDMPDTYEAY